MSEIAYRGQHTPVVSPESIHDRVTSVGPLREEIAWSPTMRQLTDGQFGDAIIVSRLSAWAINLENHLVPLYT